MKLNAFIKGLIMALVGFIATTISDLSGEESVNFTYILIASIGFTVVYIAKNYKFPSVSALGFDLRDVISGLILAIGMGISSTVAQILTTGFDAHTLWVAVSGAVVGYVLKTLPNNAKK